MEEKAWKFKSIHVFIEQILRLLRNISHRISVDRIGTRDLDRPETITHSDVLCPGEL
jgi:hypothetical protein